MTDWMREGKMINIGSAGSLKQKESGSKPAGKMSAIKALLPLIEPLVRSYIKNNKSTVLKVTISVLLFIYLLICGIVFNIELWTK